MTRHPRPGPALCLLAALAALAACAVERDEAGLLGPYFFACDDGRLLTVRFDTVDGTARVLVPGRPPHVLPQARAASGYWYTDGRRSLRGKDREVQWQDDGAPAVTCWHRAR